MELTHEMASESINVKVTGELRAHVERQTAAGGIYESASEYIRDLIRQDKRHSEDGLQWLRSHLAPLTETPDEEFIEAGAEEVIQKAKRRYLRDDPERREE